jgi:hypothetical protein
MRTRDRDVQILAEIEDHIVGLSVEGVTTLLQGCVLALLMIHGHQEEDIRDAVTGAFRAHQAVEFPPTNGRIH